MELCRRDVFDDDLAISQTVRRLAIANHAHLLAAGAVRIRKIEPMIGSKLWMQSEAHQSAFAARLDIRHGKKRFRPQLSVFINTHSAWPLSKDHSTVRRPHD